MTIYPKQILSLEQQIQALEDSGMEIESQDDARKSLLEIGYYRLRGYSFPLYNNSQKQYLPGTKFSDILALYKFDQEMSTLLFSMLSQIEVALRARLLNALLTAYGDALILQDPSVYKNKEQYWKNASSVASEIARSGDIFIKHNFQSHDGLIPIWAAIEVLSFGTLSKIIRNLTTEDGGAYKILAEHYRFRTANGRSARPSIQMFSTWMHSAVILRNMCAHNSRLYNRIIATRAELLRSDRNQYLSLRPGIYMPILAMKYLRPNDAEWNKFVDKLSNLIDEYAAYIKLSAISFPDDWKEHLYAKL